MIPAKAPQQRMTCHVRHASSVGMPAL